VAEAAHRCGLPLHLDGARIFNAALALETTRKEIASSADTVHFACRRDSAARSDRCCAVSEDYIARARRARKMLGGGMRQAGVIAAAGIVALDTMIDRLAEIIRMRARWHRDFALVAGLNVRKVANRTNMVVFDVDGDAKVAGSFALR